MAAWMALCSSSMVLSFDLETAAVGTRRPLFVGDVHIDAGAENSPALFPPHSFHLEFKLPENEWGCRRVSRFSLSPPWKNKKGLTAFAYLFNTRLTSNFNFFLSSHLSPVSKDLRHFVSLDRENDLDFIFLLISLVVVVVFLSSSLLLLLLLSRFWTSKGWWVGRLRASEVEERGEMEVWERRWRGRRWPWKKISSAGDKSKSKEGVGLHLFDGWREIVNENSWDGEEEDEGGREPAEAAAVLVDLSCFVDWVSSSFPCLTAISSTFLSCCKVSMTEKSVRQKGRKNGVNILRLLLVILPFLFIYGS